MKQWLPVVILLTPLALWLTGCESDHAQLPPGTIASNSTPLDAPEIPWPFWPQRMRIHPLSYVVDDPLSGQTVVETRLEFFDPDGHTTRCVGVVRIEMHNASNLFNADPLVWWQQDLTDLALNARFFDDVTRTYLMRLEIDPAQIPSRPHLVVQFRSADGRSFTAEYDLPDRRVEPLPSPEPGEEVRR